MYYYYYYTLYDNASGSRPPVFFLGPSFCLQFPRLNSVATRTAVEIRLFGSNWIVVQGGFKRSSTTQVLE